MLVDLVLGSIQMERITINVDLNTFNGKIDPNTQQPCHLKYTTLLYPIIRNKRVDETSPGLLLIPEFEALFYDHRIGDRYMRFVMMVADYDSPLKQHPEKRRRELAILSTGAKTEATKNATLDEQARGIVDGTNKRVEAAIVKYKQIQYNEDRENLEMFTKQIAGIKAIIMTPTDDVAEMEKRNKLLASIPTLVESKKALARLTNITEEVYESETTTESRPMSLIDKVALENQEAKE